MTTDLIENYHDCTLYEVQKTSEQSLMVKLKKMYKGDPYPYCDVSLTASDGKQVHGHKLLMALRSDYFAALFTYEPTKSNFQVPQFDSKLLEVIIKSMVEINLQDIEEVGFVEYLQAADFLQLIDLVDAVSKLISIKEITFDNVFDILELTKNINAPVLEQGCLKFIKENIRHSEIQGRLKTLSIDSLLKVFAEPRPDLKDQFDRKLDKLAVILLHLDILFNILKEKNEEDFFYRFLDTCFVRDHLYFFATLDKTVIQPLEGDLETELSMSKIGRFRQNTELMSQIKESCPRPSVPFEWPWRTTLWSQKFGNMYEIQPGDQLQDQEWIFEGTFSKICIKMRARENANIIQGLQVFLDDGDIKTVGMEMGDVINVQTIEIPPGKYIRDINMMTSSYVDRMEFIGDDGKKLNANSRHHLLSSNLGSRFGFALDSSEVYKAGLHFHEHFLSGMRGRIMLTQGAPCICDLQFKFTFIPPPDNLRKRYEQVLKMQK